jgi:hypothetical protein
MVGRRGLEGLGVDVATKSVHATKKKLSGGEMVVIPTSPRSFSHPPVGALPPGGLALVGFLLKPA